MTGSRKMTTFRKLPMSRPIIKTRKVKDVGED